jgi:hypothetical protein
MFTFDLLINSDKIILTLYCKVTRSLEEPDLFTYHFITLSNFFIFFCSYELVETLKFENHWVKGPIHYYVFNSLLFCLLVLNIYWWVLILRMLVGQIRARGKVSEDIRSGKLKDSLHI